MKTVKDAYESVVNNEWCESDYHCQVVLCCVQYSNDDEGVFEVGELYTGSNGFSRDYFYQVCTRKEFEDYAKMQKLNSINKEAVKPVYTQEMADNGELPPVGFGCMFKHQSEDNIMFDDCFIVGYSKCGKFIIFHNHQNQLMQHNIVNGPYRFKPIDTRTDKEKLIDEVAELIGLISEDVNCSYESGAKALIEKFDIKLK